MKDKFVKTTIVNEPIFQNTGRADIINELLGLNERVYFISDIFKYLPHSIIYNGHRGDLCVSVVDIAYFSIDSDWKHILVHHEPIPIGGDVYDAFIAMIKWLKENNLMQ